MKTKKEFRYFNIFQYQKEQEYLRRRHQEGWRFVKVSGLGVYHFEACTPEDVVYQLDYNQEGLAHKEEYVQIFRDCGWEYLQDYAGYSYFCKPASRMEGEEEIFCDDQSRLEMMERVYKGRMVPVLVLFCAVLVPQFILNLTVYHNVFLSAVYAAILVLYLAVFGSAVRHYRKLKQETET